MTRWKRLYPCCPCCDPRQSRDGDCGPHGVWCGIDHDAEGEA